MTIINFDIRKIRNERKRKILGSTAKRHILLLLPKGIKILTLRNVRIYYETDKLEI